MNDLLGDVKGGQGSGALNFNATDANRDVEAGIAPPPPPLTEKAMDSFFKDVAVIKGMLNTLKSKQQHLVEQHEKSKTLTRSSEVREIKDDIQKEVDEVLQLMQVVKVRLDALDKSNADAMKRKGSEQGTAQERTRSAVTGALRTKLVDLGASFGELRTRLHQDYRELVERRAYTVRGEKPSEEQVDKMIESGESETIFQQAILEQGRGRVAETLAAIQERHTEVMQLEKQLMDLHQIFLDMGVLVESQGEMLNNIEAQVARSVDYVQGGTTALIQAKKYQKSTRKLICCALVIVLIIVAIVVVVAIQPWKK